MKPDDIESQLQALRLQELPAAWKNEVLSAAMTRSVLARLAPPMWMAWSLVASWVFIAVLQWSTPAPEAVQVVKAPPVLINRQQTIAALLVADASLP